MYISTRKFPLHFGSHSDPESCMILIRSTDIGEDVRSPSSGTLVRTFFMIILLLQCFYHYSE